MTNTFIIITGLFVAVVAAIAVNKLSRLIDLADDLVAKNVFLTNQLRQMQSDNNQVCGQLTTAAGGMRTDAIHAAAQQLAATEALKEAVDSQTRTLSECTDRYIALMNDLQSAAEADGAHEGDEGTLLVEHPEPEPATATGHASMGPIVEDNPDE